MLSIAEFQNGLAGMRRLNVAVAGCGPCELAAALLLERQGHDVSLFERFEAPKSIGSGLMMQPTGMQLTFARYSHRTFKHPVERALIHIGDAWHSANPQLGQGANMAVFTPAYPSDSRILPVLREGIVGPPSKLWPATWIQATTVSGLIGGPLSRLGLNRAA